MEKKVTSNVTKGLIIALILIVLNLVLYFVGQSQNKPLGILISAIFVGGIIWSCISYAKDLEGNVTFGNTFAHGFKVAATVTALYLVYTFLALKFITPGIIDLAIEEAKKGMEEKKNLTTEQVDSALEMMRKYFVPFAIGGALLAYLVLGLISAAIGAAVAKKNPVQASPFQ
ncbi:DUF4199 domain-containing protein [Chitinophagaceae bacterium LWZ2-11]